MKTHINKIYILLMLVLTFTSVGGHCQSIKVYTNIDSAKKDKNNQIILDLSNKSLNEIPKDVYKIKNLKTLNLDDNNISEIPSDIKKLKSVEDISLLNNNIVKVSNEIFELNTLKQLDIKQQSIGRETLSETAIYLKSIGDREAYTEILKTPNVNWVSSTDAFAFLSKPLPWQFTSHAFGYFYPDTSTSISSAVNIKADTSLRNKSVKISLDMLYVKDYPGSGKHQVLFDFKAKNQIQHGDEQTVHFNQTTNVQENQFAALISIPIFVGLTVGKDGIDFECKTINVRNENDGKFLSILESNEVKNGLKLVNSINPVVPIVSSLAEGIAKQMATRNDNKTIQDFNMGLDFSNIGSRAKLREGTYIAVQVDNLASWKWSDWIYNTTNGIIVSKTNSNITIPYNYLLFSISRAK